MSIIIASTDEIDEYDDIAADLLSSIFGITQYMISDRSTLADFAMCCLPDDNTYDALSYDEVCDIADQRMIKAIFTRYGIFVTPTMTLVEVCRLIDSPSTTIH